MASLIKSMINATGTDAARAIRTKVRDMPGGFGSTSQVTRTAMRPAPTARAVPNVNRPPSRNVAPAITMPAPSMRRPGMSSNASVTGSDGRNAAMGSMVGASAGASFGAIYGNDDGTVSGAARGAFRGALGGAVGGAMLGAGLPAAARYGASNNKFMSAAGSYSSGIASMSKALNTSEGRNSLFMAGGMLGSMGANSGGSKSRGINKNRGTHINSRNY